MQHQYYSLKQVAEIVGGQLVGAAHGRKISDLLIDSRHLMDPYHTLFFALVPVTTDTSLLPSCMRRACVPLWLAIS